MDSYTKLKSFLPETQRQKANYEWYKPVIKLTLRSAAVFLIINIMLSGGIYLYTQSIQSNDSELQEYKAAQKLNDELNTQLNIISSIKKDFNAINVLNSIVTNVPDEIVIEKIDIDSDKSLIMGNCKEIKSIQQYAQSINYPGYSAELSNVKKDKEGNNQFSIELKKVKPVKKPLPPKKVGEK